MCDIIVENAVESSTRACCTDYHTTTYWPHMTFVVNIIGAGKLGQTLGRLVVKHNLAKIAGIHNRSQHSAMAAIQFIGDGEYCPEIKGLPPADITFITTPDDHLAETSLQIARSGHIKPGSIFIHCSGILTSEVISAVKLKDALVMSIHPMRSFANPALSVENFPGTYCATEGDRDALKIIEPFFESIGSINFQIMKDKKPLYHAAGVFASNYLVTLTQEAINCLIAANVEKKMALQMMIHLMKGTLSNLEKSMSPLEALTGPIERGDLATIKKHLSSLPSDKQRLLYSVMGKATIELTSHDVTTKQKLDTVLSSAYMLARELITDSRSSITSVIGKKPNPD